MSAASWSVRTPLMARTICPTCQHMHRVALADACECCRADTRRAVA